MAAITEMADKIVVDTSVANMSATPYSEEVGFTHSPSTTGPGDEGDESDSSASDGSPQPHTPTISRPSSRLPHPSLSPVSPVSPFTPREAHVSTDSMASIALSQSSLDYDHFSTQQLNDALATPRVSGIRHMRKPSSLEILQNNWGPPTRQSTLFDNSKDEPLETPLDGAEYEDERSEKDGEIRRITDSTRPSAEKRSPSNDDETESNAGSGSVEVVSIRSHSSVASIPLERSESPRTLSTGSAGTPRRTSSSSSDEMNEVDWQQLDRHEEQEKEDREVPEGAEDESTAFLLARLEHENAKFSLDPKSATPNHVTRARSASRPPSMGHLKKLVQDRNAPSIRYSLAPDMAIPEQPPAMTELEFWAALVQDYPSTAVRLPTLTTSKIRSGIPPPLRGVVWTSMAGARDKSLEDAFDKLQGEKSPYEGIINKDVGRSFPGVELFMDAEGEGQKMLGRVLKCFSLHDKDIGYCQGLGFLVGPLLMNMGEREAFCVLVKLMDHYTLRPSFLPSLSGLHMRIFQFSSLLKQHMPELWHHFDELGVEPPYLSQWFLSCFAVTCPLPMLFRIYDVIFAEGANETVMRVALALMRRNEQKMMESTEFDEVMQLLLGPAIWDCYACNADELVDDFTSLGNVITHARLAELEREFESKDGETVGQSAGFLPDVQAAASRFLGRLWAPAHTHTPSKSTSTNTLSPQTAEKDPGASSGHSRTPSFFLRKSSSKQSVSTINESTGSDSSGSGSTGSMASTTPTEPDAAESAQARQSTADSMSITSKAGSLRTASINHSQASQSSGFANSKEQQDLHGQIEDLLTALSEMQREHAQLAAIMQREREERSEDHRHMRKLVKRLQSRRAEQGVSDPKEKLETAADKRRTLPAPPRTSSLPDRKERPVSLQGQLGGGLIAKDELSGLITNVEERLEMNTRFSSSYETKAQLRSTIARTREQLAAAENYSRDLQGRLEDAETSLPAFQTESEDLRTEVRELRSRVNEEFKTRQKLEHTVRELKAQTRSLERKDRDRLMKAESIGEAPIAGKIDGGIPGDGSAGRRRGGSVSSAPVPMAAAGLRELRLGKDGRRESTSSVQSLRLRTQRQSSVPQQQLQQPQQQQQQDCRQTQSPSMMATWPPPTVEIAMSPLSPLAIEQPALDTPRSATPVSALGVPGNPFGQRTSSLATQEVFATPEHESVPEEALLLELVNAKTAEAQARQEVDESRRALAVQKRRYEEALAQMRAETEAAKAEIEKVRREAEESLLMTPSLSVPNTPAAYDADSKGFPGFGSTSETPHQLEVRKAATPPTAKTASTSPSAAASGGGWFWSRRTASVNKAVVLEEGKDK